MDNMDEKRVSVQQKKLSSKPNLANYEKDYKNFDWKDIEKELSFFDDGKFNSAYNAIERHSLTDVKNRVAIYWISDDGATGTKFTFDELNKLSNKFANLLTTLGVSRGDRVFFFLPRIPEIYYGFLGTLKC